MTHLQLFARLADYIPDEHVKFREGATGGHYVKAPTVMNRLDSVVGPAGWWDDYRIIDDLTVECSLTIRLPDGKTLTKRDVGIRKPPKPDRVDAGSSWKAAYSDALKRAASKFGVARHLCKCGFADFVGPTLAGEGEPKPLPPPAVVEHAVVEPARSPAPPPPAPPAKERNAWGDGKPVAPVAIPQGRDKAPTSGRGLFAWTKEQEQRHEVALLKHLNSWAKRQEFPGRMVDWDRDQVEQGHAEAIRKLQSITNGQAEVYEEALAS